MFAIFPPLAIFALLGFYSLHILYKVVPVVTRVPENKAPVFTLALIACGFAAYVVLGSVASLLLTF